MNLANTEDDYGLIARLFHWTVAILILGLLPVGLFMGGMENSPVKFEVFALHKSFGLLVFFLGLARLAWRFFFSPPPDHVETHKRWETVLASAAHFWLYVCVIGMPLSGWLMSSAGEFPVPFFGIQMPQLIGKNEELGDLFYEIHEILGFTLLVILGLHIAGALKHHILDKDETLQRMTFRNKGLVLPVLVILLAGASYAASGYTMLMEEEEEEAPAAAISSNTPAIPLPSVEGLPAHGWAIVPAQSKLQFQASFNQTPFTGDFKTFSGTIVFDPANISTAKADITIPMKDVTTGDADRDTNMKGAEWFDVENFPESRFESTKFEKADGNNYVAIGTLTLRGLKMPLILPFTLDLADKKAHMTGKVSFNRLNFGVGTGQWEDGKTIGLDVDVLVDLVAIQ